ncbi:putative serine protease HtrA [Thalassoglobus neptunius]|uniref:Putative serine protease HtrA n=1 Tax=Thalassoglobus neptunius TaxID=1938619 RepID=A0A5C5X885_9PLAN|nr:S1C family serine protease [Thalassoglobus neptunius]TWT59048.1 putative serine protease HtrA [Thalassoglobus neptunius]
MTVSRRFLICSIVSLAMTLTTGAASQAESFSNAVDQVQPKVVKLFGAGGLKNLANYGTGVLVSPDGHIATVWNHLLDSDVVTVVLHDGRRFFGKVVGTDSKVDLAIIKIEAEDLPFFNISDTAEVGPGALILAFSNVFKVATGDEPVSVMQGVVSAKTKLAARRGRYRASYDGDVYLVDAVTNNPGAAGGVLTTADGKLLGMLGRELKGTNNTWLNYAIPFSVLEKSINDIVAGRFSRTDDLLAVADETESSGFQSIDFGFLLVPDVVARTPAYVDSVIEETEAAKLGLQPDDLIVFANGELVHSIQTLQGVFQRLLPGDDLQLIVRRNNELVTFTFEVPRKQ